MPSHSPAEPWEEFTSQVKGQAAGALVLCLYISGSTPRSRRAIANLNRLCEGELAGRCQLEVIDVSRHPEVARSEQILATPTLIKKLPEPFRQLIGDLSDKERVLVALDLQTAD